MQGETRILFRFFYLFLKDFLYKLLIFPIGKKGAVALKISAQPLFCAKKLQPGFRKVWLLV